jgi:hypothetical protein
LMMEEEALDQIKKGKFTLDDLGMPEWKDWAARFETVINM